MAAGDRFFGPNGACGEVVGTGALITVTLGFKPIRVRIMNRTQLAEGKWNHAMPQDSAFMTDDSGAGTTDISFVTSNAITSGNNGFTIGTTAALNTASDVIYWEADRSMRN